MILLKLTLPTWLLHMELLPFYPGIEHLSLPWKMPCAIVLEITIFMHRTGMAQWTHKHPRDLPFGAMLVVTGEDHVSPTVHLQICVLFIKLLTVWRVIFNGAHYPLRKLLVCIINKLLIVAFVRLWRRGITLVYIFGWVVISQSCIRQMIRSSTYITPISIVFGPIGKDVIHPQHAHTEDKRQLVPQHRPLIQ